MTCRAFRLATSYSSSFARPSYARRVRRCACGEFIRTRWRAATRTVGSAGSRSGHQGRSDPGCPGLARRARSILQGARHLPEPTAIPKVCAPQQHRLGLYHLDGQQKPRTTTRRHSRLLPREASHRHAFINLATLYKAQGRTRATIKAYQAAVDLTKQMPTWANLGWELIHDCRVEEAVTTLSEAISAKGDAAPAAQQVYAYLGVAQSQRRRWALASQAFVKSIDIGLPADADGCKGGRWKVPRAGRTRSTSRFTRFPCSPWCKR